MALVWQVTNETADGEEIGRWVDDGVYEPDDGVYSGGTSQTPSLSVDKLLNWLSTPAGAAIGIAGLDKIFGGKLGSLMGFGTAGNAGAAGYKGKIPELTATQTQIAQPAYVPYSGQAVMGRSQLSNIAYTPTPTSAPTTAPPATTPPPVTTPPATTPPPRNDEYQNPGGNAAGGIIGLAAGGSAKRPRYLQGITDGMADKIDTDIDGKQAAKLSHGEFVIPADIVSHLGNGNSDAGAKVLYKMMDRVRLARTGNSKQGKKINPDKFTPGGLTSLPAYAGGGAVAFDVGGAIPTPVAPVTRETNLSEWAGPTITGMLGKATALAQSPYQAYTGPLTAGTSPLQQQAFTAAGSLKTPTAMGDAVKTAGNVATNMGNLSYKPVGSDFTTAQATQYMNPYLQASLDPQIAEARRQSEITQMGNAAKLTQAGAFGGSRGALMQSEAQRNLGTNLANITGQGYNTAYDKAMQQFNADQTRKVGEGQFGSTFGLQALQGQQAAAATQGTLANQENQAGIANLNAQSAAGATQRSNEQEGITALRNQFEEQRQDPYNKLLFQQKMLAGLPVSTQTTSTAQTPMQSFGGTVAELEAILKKFGL